MGCPEEIQTYSEKVNDGTRKAGMCELRPHTRNPKNLLSPASPLCPLTLPHVLSLLPAEAICLRHCGHALLGPGELVVLDCIQYNDLGRYNES